MPQHANRYLLFFAGESTSAFDITIELSALSVAEDAEVNDVIGTLLVSGGSGTYTFSITSDPDAKFQIANDDELQVADDLDFETKTSHPVTISADNGVDDPIERTFTITVTNIGLASLTLGDPSQPLYQRDAGGSSFDVPVTGTYTEESAAVEVKILLVANDSTVVDWATLDAAPAGGTFSGTVTVPEGGPYYTQVRSADETAITDENMSEFSVGVIVVDQGQSNALNFGVIGGSGGFSPGNWMWKDGVGWHQNADYARAADFLNTLSAALGIPVGGFAVNTAGTNIETLIGGNFTDIYLPRLAAVGGDAELIIMTHGESNASDTASVSTYQGQMATLHENMANACDRTTAQMPMIISEIGRATTGGSELGWSRIRRAQATAPEAVDDLYYSHSTLDLLLGGDGLHYDFGSEGHGVHATRFAHTCAVVLGADTGTLPWFITGADRQSGTVTRVTVEHSMGTDFTPTSDISGFEVSSDNWATPLECTGARVDATHIDLTHESIDEELDVKVRYQYGVNPDISGIVQDNSAYTSPLNDTGDLSFTAEGDSEVEAPTPTYINTFINTGNGGAGPHILPADTGGTPTSPIDIGTAYASRRIIVWLDFGQTATATNVSFIPDEGDPITPTIVYNGPRGFIFSAVVPEGTTMQVGVTFSSNPFGRPNMSVWSVDDDTLVDGDTAIVDVYFSNPGTADTLSLADVPEGAFVLLSALNSTTSGQSLSVTGDISFATRFTSVGAGHINHFDASNVPAGSKDVTVTFAASGTMRALVAAFR